MADIDQIIAGGAGSSSRADFSGLAGLLDAYFSGAKQGDELQTRRAFKDGVPLDANGQPDFGAMSKTFFQKGDPSQGIAAANLDLQRQQLKFGQQQSAGIQNFEGGGQPSAQPSAPILPPSANRSASAPVAPPLSAGGGPSSTPQGDQPGSVISLLGSAGVPDAQTMMVAGPIAKTLGIDPNAPIPPAQVPRVQAAIQAYAQRNGIAPQAAPPGPQGEDVPLPRPRPPEAPQAGPVAPQPGSSAPMQPTPVPTQAITPGQPAPVTNAVTTPNAPATPSRTDQAIAYYASIMSNPMTPKATAELAKTRLEALQKNNELTPAQKDYSQYRLQGGTLTQDDFSAKQEADKAYAKANTESYIKKYDTIQTAGERARVDLPQLDLARKLTEDPNFYSGVGEKYNLLMKRAVTALGGDPNTAAPQEAFRKIVSNSILDQIKGMAGTGPIRVAEMKIMQDAAANPDNTPQSNRLLLELSSRLQKRSAAIADMAQSYNGGRLDSGFDRKVADYDRKNPMISDKEIPDFRKIINPEKTQGAVPPVPNARQAPDGNWYTPDPSRPGKYLRVSMSETDTGSGDSSSATAGDGASGSFDAGVPAAKGTPFDKRFEGDRTYEFLKSTPFPTKKMQEDTQVRDRAMIRGLLNQGWKR